MRELKEGIGELLEVEKAVRRGKRKVTNSSSNMRRLEMESMAASERTSPMAMQEKEELVERAATDMHRQRERNGSDSDRYPTEVLHHFTTLRIFQKKKKKRKKLAYDL
ncbi:hypothetical protein ACH5RR_026412 [Cinchona calisaya]|uniref:Uncharacterized protein n=1 Tax=Cinchona calisaya TaxID=153742 RepID=A0ABD2Z2H9_9GENT